jgi:hypothetical protein
MLANGRVTKPLTLTLSPQAERGDYGVCRLSLLPVHGEKVADRPDEGPRLPYRALPRGIAA